MKKDVSEAVSVRRRPTQERSKNRVEDILAIALQLIMENGAEHLSLREVARRAGIPIASVYQYFPSKVGILRELITRSRERALQRLREAAMELPAKKEEKSDPRRSVSHLVDAFLSFYSQDPGVIEVWGGVQGDPNLRKLDAEDTLATAEWLAPALLGGTAIRDTTEALAVAMLITEATAAAARLLCQSDAKYHPAIIASLKTMLAAPLHKAILLKK